ncbi:MAG: transcriptional repressor [Clostridia bacterium]|nr:transcriptional repressor [Clostridia bacterium]
MDIAQYLQDHHVKPSYPRVRILEYMLEKRNHPTVDMIYSELSKELPTLSRTTVYNTVDLFLEKGLVQLIGIDEQETRYDADITAHAHFRCDQCGKILDLRLTGEAQAIQGMEQLKVREVQIYLKGLCQECQTYAPSIKK